MSIIINLSKIETVYGAKAVVLSSVIVNGVLIYCCLGNKGTFICREDEIKKIIY